MVRLIHKSTHCCIFSYIKAIFYDEEFDCGQRRGYGKEEQGEKRKEGENKRRVELEERRREGRNEREKEEGDWKRNGA